MPSSSALVSAARMCATSSSPRLSVFIPSLFRPTWPHKGASEPAPLSSPNAFTLSVAIAGIMETGPVPPSILECQGLPEAELPPDSELGQAESAEDEDEEDEV